MSSQFGHHVSQHNESIVCPHCGRTGAVRWEEGEGTGRDLLTIEGAFYERLCKTAPHPIELVCSHCGTAQPGGE